MSSVLEKPQEADTAADLPPVVRYYVRNAINLKYWEDRRQDATINGHRYLGRLEFEGEHGEKVKGTLRLLG